MKIIAILKKYPNKSKLARTIKPPLASQNIQMWIKRGNVPTAWLKPLVVALNETLGTKYKVDDLI